VGEAVLRLSCAARTFGRVAAPAALALASAICGCAGSCPRIPPAEKATFLGVRPEEGGYVINAGDQLQIEVWQNTQLTRGVVVRPDGKITLPLVNDIPAATMTVPQFQASLVEKLKTYLKDPIVSVTVNQFTSKQIFIQGQVKAPSAYTYRGEMYLLQALAISGGTSPFSEGCAVVVRKKGDQFVRYDVRMEPLLTGENMKENILLLPNDVITVQ
jgi:polysaccharide export outer membrane protein